jgi:hypothetical protein
MDSTVVVAIVGYALYIISEILPFLPIPVNGILHSIILTLKKGLSLTFNSLPQDIEMAKSLVRNKSFANVVNTINTNPQIQKIINNLISDPSSANNLTTIQANPNINSIVSYLHNNPQAQTLFNNLISDPQIYNKVLSLQSEI